MSVSELETLNAQLARTTWATDDRPTMPSVPYTQPARRDVAEINGWLILTPVSQVTR